MFFYLSKILSFLITPIVWIFALLVFGLISKNQKRKKYAFIGGVVLFYFFTNSFILEAISRLWEVRATRYDELEIYDAGIVLGGILNYDEEFDRIQFYRSADRLFQAIELYKTGVIKKIFFVGGSGSIEFAHIREGMFVRRFLLTMGIPEEDIWIENESRNTRENAVNARKILDDNNYLSGNFLLITSACHMRRALACFKKIGIKVIPYSTDRRAGFYSRFTPEHLFIPDVEALIGWDMLLHEWVGMVVYKLCGYA